MIYMITYLKICDTVILTQKLQSALNGKFDHIEHPYIVDADGVRAAVVEVHLNAEPSDTEREACDKAVQDTPGFASYADPELASYVSPGAS